MELKQTVEIVNSLGMHARPSMKLFELVQGFDAEIMLRNDNGKEAGASSIIDLLMLESAQGCQVEITATGAQAEQALNAVMALIASGFGEE